MYFGTLSKTSQKRRWKRVMKSLQHRGPRGQTHGGYCKLYHACTNGRGGTTYSDAAVRNCDGIVIRVCSQVQGTKGSGFPDVKYLSWLLQLCKETRDTNSHLEWSPHTDRLFAGTARRNCLTDGNVQTPSGRITSPLEVAQHLRTQFCRIQWKKESMKMKINQVVVMYHKVFPTKNNPVVCPHNEPGLSVHWSQSGG